MCTPWWYYPLAIFSPQAASIVTETEIAALALHTAHALNDTSYSTSLLNEDISIKESSFGESNDFRYAYCIPRWGMCPSLG